MILIILKSKVFIVMAIIVKLKKINYRNKQLNKKKKNKNKKFRMINKKKIKFYERKKK